MIRKRKNQTGAAMVEFAIVLCPLLVMLLYGIVEFGNLLMTFNILNKVTMNAARYLSMQKPVPDYVTTVTKEKVNAINLMTCGQTKKCTTGTRFLNTAPCDPIKTCPTFETPANYVTATGVITLKVDYPYKPVFYYIVGTKIEPKYYTLHSTVVIQSIL